MDDEYEILPKNELDYLRKEVEKLKKNPYGNTETGKTLLDSMQELTNSINKLISLFQTTQKELVEEYAKSNPSETLSEILDQNEKIAKGTLAVADLIKKQQESVDEIKAQVKSEKQDGQTQNVQPEIPDFGSQGVQNLNQNNQQNVSQNPFDNKIPDMNSSFNNPKKMPEIPPLSPINSSIPELKEEEKRGLFNKK